MANIPGKNIRSDPRHAAVLLPSKSKLDQAGRDLFVHLKAASSSTSPEAVARFSECHDLIHSWRAAHAFPLNTMQISLRNKAGLVSADAFTAQRLKRFESVLVKLRRFPTMNLSQMQDIGGCRAVLPRVEHVYALLELYEHSKIRHTRARLDDYIKEPRASGYRGIHLVYRYNSDKVTTYNGLSIELQIRSQLQHSWATAVETFGTFTRQALKSSIGQPEWLRLFALMGSEVARLEGAASVPGADVLTANGRAELRHLARSLGVAKKLSTYQAALNATSTVSTRNAKYYLLVLKPESQSLSIRPFMASERLHASLAYQTAEKSLDQEKGEEAVLVSVGSVEALKRAFPNYFLDTGIFLDLLHSAVAES